MSRNRGTFVLWYYSRMISVILAVIGGLIYGSFLNVLLWRLPEGKGIGGRSHCRSCQHTLAWYDLVPVFSFIALSGRCHYCRTKIHPRYPAVELVTGLVLGLYFFVQHPANPNLEAILSVTGILVLVSLFFFDLFYMILPDVITIPMIVAYAVADLFRPDLVGHITIALLLAVFFVILYIVSRGKQLGFGDIKLVLLIGLMLGYPMGFVSVVGGIWLGALIALGLVISGKATRKDALPLGSFLSLAALIIIIFSHEIFALLAHFF